VMFIGSEKSRRNVPSVDDKHSTLQFGRT